MAEKVKPVPVVITQPEPGLRDRVPSRLGTPVAFLMLVGLVLIYFALRGWDVKYGTFNGMFSGKAGADALPSAPAPAKPPPPKPGTPA